MSPSEIQRFEIVIRRATLTLGIAAIGFGLGLSEALAAGDAWKGAWKFEMSQDQPWLGYYDPDGKTGFLIRCVPHFEVLAVVGGVQYEQDPPDAKIFDQADLGFPDLELDKWRALENRVLELLDSGQKLTISAEGKSYVLPPVKAPGWRARWQKIC